MNPNPVEDEKYFTSALITALAIGPEVPTKQHVEDKARQMADIFKYDGELMHIVEEVMIAIDTRMGAGTSLVDKEAEHDDEWIYKRTNIVWTYSNAYEKYLKGEMWHKIVIQSLSDVGTKLLGHLQDPVSEGSWDRRGLVIGHVQSGKTANYMALIAKAADAGYKFIIVIAGIHNNLRKQTQERIDDGFVGRSSDPENRKITGVGLDGKYPHPATLTTINDDFNKKTASQSGWKLNDFSKPIIIVIKKNVLTLDSLFKWLKELNAQGEGQITDVPVLMIDDEADNASINTNKPDNDPTRTNSMIRKILNLFAKSCYVGYTATPFANIFINPEAYDEDVREELFPRDFIYSLDAPNTYFGPDKVFLDEESKNKIVKAINDCEEYIPFSHKKDYEVFELPPSLYKAINQFILARAIRNLRGHANKHCSMMVNVSRFVSVQKDVRDLISIYEKKLREAVKANYAMPDTVTNNNSHMKNLEDVFNEEYLDCEFSWSDVKAVLFSVFDNLRLYVVNSKTDEVLDYKKYAKDGHSLTAIAVGGLSLSRGLTIEGLCTSYMYRNTRMYDTLMQMGRWFGYRPGYEDLCRVHLSEDSINWYEHIAEKSEELRQQIRRMRKDGLTPRQFGLYVESHPDSLLITAANKMRSGTSITIKQNYSGRLLESYILPTEKPINEENEQLIVEFWETGFGVEMKTTKKGWIAEDVDIRQIEQFLTRFKSHSDLAMIKSAAINYLQLISSDYPKGDVLFISIKDNQENSEKSLLGTQKRAAKDRIERNSWRLAKDRVASRGDESLGLSDEQKKYASRLAAEAHAMDSRKNSSPSDAHFREARSKPLLMIHVLQPDGDNNIPSRIPAYGISFPYGDYLKTVSIVANKVWIERMLGNTSDNPDEEDDYDE